MRIQGSGVFMNGGEWSDAVGSIGLAPYASLGFDYRGLHFQESSEPPIGNVKQDAGGPADTGQFIRGEP